MISKCASTKKLKKEIEIGELQRDLEKLNCRTQSARVNEANTSIKEKL